MIYQGDPGDVDPQVLDEILTVPDVLREMINFSKLENQD